MSVSFDFLIDSHLIWGLSIGSMLPAAIAFVFSVYSARRSAAAKKRISRFVRGSVRLQANLMRAFEDRKIDDAEMRIFLRTLRKVLEEEERKAQTPLNADAKRFISELHPHSNQRVAEDFAKEIEKLRMSV